LDYLRWLFGEVDSLWAFASQSSDLALGVEDTAEIGLQFKNGMLGSLHLDYNQRPPAHWLEAIGTNGTLRWDNADGAVHLYRAEMACWEMFPAKIQVEDRPFERNDMFLAEMAHFLDLIHGDCNSVCSLEDGIAVMRLALGAHASAQNASLSKF
jgi:predicted dehydrogenase